MRLSTRSRYGVRLMVELGLHFDRGSIFLKDIAKKEDISEKYLSQIIIPLKAAGLVVSFRGAHGGYALSKSPDKISIKNIIEVLEGGFNLVARLNDSDGCQPVSISVTRNLWSKLSNTIAEALSSVTLEDLVRECKEKQQSSLTYNI